MPRINKRVKRVATVKAHEGRLTHEPRYNSRRWRKQAHEYLNENPLCAKCESEGRVQGAECVDHIIQVSNKGSFWNERNHQGLCNRCHAVKSGKEKHLKGAWLYRRKNEFEFVRGEEVVFKAIKIFSSEERGVMIPVEKGYGVKF